jgi:hypothetical protein
LTRSPNFCINDVWRRRAENELFSVASIFSQSLMPAGQRPLAITIDRLLDDLATSQPQWCHHVRGGWSRIMYKDELC